MLIPGNPKNLSWFQNRLGRSYVNGLGLASWVFFHAVHSAPSRELAPLIYSNATSSLADTSASRLETWPEGDFTADSNGIGSLEAYARIHPIGFSGWDSGGGMYAVAQSGEFPQLNLIASPQSKPAVLSFFTSRVAGFYPNPDPRHNNFLFLQDENGNEQFRLWLFDMKIGRIQTLGCPPGRVTNVLWGDSGKNFVYVHTPEGTDRWDIRWGNSAGEGRLLISRPGSWIPLDWSQDEKSLLVQKYISASESELYLFSLSQGRLTRLLPNEKRQFLDHALWIRLPGENGRQSLCFTSDRDGEFHRLYLLRLKDRKIRPLSPAANWDVEWVNASTDRRTLIYSLNEEGRSRLYLMRPPERTPVALAKIPSGIVEGVRFRRDSQEFAFTLNNSSCPGEIYAYRINGERVTRWTVGATGMLSEDRFHAPKLIRFPAFDSIVTKGNRRVPRMIPAWLYLPSRTARPSPVLVQIHGGPELQARPGFDAFIQYAVEQLGVAVVLPNVRGSTGYGKSFVRADDGYARMNSVRDIGALLAWIRKRPELNSEQIAVAGRSYGGFMAMSSLIHFGDQLRAGISTVGIGHFPTFLRNTSGYRRDLRRAEYGDERDPRMAAFLDSISPLSSLGKLKKPLLLCHGRNDPRVPYEESRHIFQALKQGKIPVWFLTFPGEGHAFRGEAAQLLHYRVMEEFLSQYLNLHQ